MHLFLRWAVVVMVFIVTGVAVQAEDWPEFRGPAGNGHATAAKLPVHWSATENVTWKQSMEPGQGWSSPVVVKNRVYLTVAVPEKGVAAKSDYSLRLVAFDVTNGAKLLDAEIFREEGNTAPGIHTKNSHASPTPLVDRDRVYVHFGHEGTACLDLAGKQIWQNRSLRYSPVHGAGGTPILVDGILIFSCDGAADPFVVGLDARTGDVRWKVARDTDADKKFSFSTATLIEVDGQRQVITPGSNIVLALDPATGAEIWRVRYDGYSVIPKPVFGNGILYVCTGYDRPQLLAIRLGGKGDVTSTHVAWKTDRDVPHTPSLLLVNQELFMVSDKGLASCLDAKTGKVVWDKKRLGGGYSASPLYANGLIYFQSEDGNTTIIKASRDYEVVATNSLEERTLASYAVNGNSLFLRSDKYLYRIDEK